jgi:hypothetical protein
VARAGERSRAGERDAFVAAVEAELRRAPDVASRTEQAAPIEQLWLGLERYWRKRREAAAETQRR